MRAILFDADVFICARSLELLELFTRSDQLDLLMTEYIARHELNGLASQVRALEEQGILRIETIVARSEGYRHFKKLRREKGVHKGGAEAIAWAMSLPRDGRPVFISNDGEARKGAEDHGVPAGDLMDLVVAMLEHGMAEYRDVRERLGPWDDRKQERCRPRDYDGFDSTYQRRRRRWYA